MLELTRSSCEADVRILRDLTAMGRVWRWESPQVERTQGLNTFLGEVQLGEGLKELKPSTWFCQQIWEGGVTLSEILLYILLSF